MITGNTTKLRLGSGELNALVIRNENKTDLATLMRAVVETPGNNPGPAERALNRAQERVLDQATSAVIKVGQTACEIAEASLASDSTRVGDAGQAIEIEFSCSAGEECCQLGLTAARGALRDQAVTAHRAVNEGLMNHFSILGVRPA